MPSPGSRTTVASRPAAVSRSASVCSDAGRAAVAGDQQHRAGPVLRDRLGRRRRRPRHEHDGQRRRPRRRRAPGARRTSAAAGGGEAGEHSPTVPAVAARATVRWDRDEEARRAEPGGVPGRLVPLARRRRHRQPRWCGAGCRWPTRWPARWPGCRRSSRPRSGCSSPAAAVVAGRGRRAVADRRRGSSSGSPGCSTPSTARSRSAPAGPRGAASSSTPSSTGSPRPPTPRRCGWPGRPGWLAVAFGALCWLPDYLRARAGQAGVRRDRRAVGLGAADPGGPDRLHARRGRRGRRRWARPAPVVTAGAAVGALLGAVGVVAAGLLAAPDAGRLSSGPDAPGGRPTGGGLLRCCGALLRSRAPDIARPFRRSAPEGASRARRRHRLHRHRPPDDLPGEVHRAVRRGPDGERLALLPRRRPRAAPRRRRREHGLRAGPARACSRCSSARSAATSPTTRPG